MIIKVNACILYLLIIVVFIFLIKKNSYAATWYVRPATGEYGLENGKSYENAFGGFTDIVWGQDGVMAGDTLLVCGIFNGEDFRIGASGNEGSPITIASGTIVNGSSINDPGIIWAAQYWTTDGWEGPDKFGVFNRRAINGHMAVDDDMQVLYMCDGQFDEKACVITHPNSWYYDSNRIYYKPGTQGLKNLHFYIPYAYALDISQKSYITIKDLTLYMGQLAVIKVFKRDTDTIPAKNIMIKNNIIRFAPYFGIQAGEGADNTTIFGNTFIDCAAGVYFTFGESDNVTITENEFYHTKNIDLVNPQFRVSNTDMSAVNTGGGGDHWSVTDNYIHDWKGEGILFYVSGYPNTMKYFEISRNRIYIDSDDSLFNAGIMINGDNAVDLADRTEGGVISYNIITGVELGASADYGAAIRTKIGIPTNNSNRLKVYNNVIYNCYTGFYGRNNSSESEIGVDFKNNIISSPKTGGYFINIENVKDSSGIDIDYNIYHGGGKWKLYGKTISTISFWRTCSKQDSHSFVSDPLFINIADRNFTLQAISHAINSGINVGLKTDFDGKPINEKPDIGAFEFSDIDLMMTIIKTSN